MHSGLTTGDSNSPAGPRTLRQVTARTQKERFEGGSLSAAELLQERSAAIDLLLRELWQSAVAENRRLEHSVALLATGGYGRRELFPFSDVDLLFVLTADAEERTVKDAIRSISKGVWDAGVRFAPVTRRLPECETVDPQNLEFALSLLDLRFITGSEAIAGKLLDRGVVKLVAKHGKLLLAGLAELTRQRHAKYGDTLFHLEPNIKECPGGLRDIHVARWVARLRDGKADDHAYILDRARGEFEEAAEFLTSLRCFLHLRHERDDNVLDWHSQDRAAELHLGVAVGAGGELDRAPDAAYWMRVYFRHARAVQRVVVSALPARRAFDAPAKKTAGLRPRSAAAIWPPGYESAAGRLSFLRNGGDRGDGGDPETVFRLFAGIAETGATPDAPVEDDLLAGLPSLAARLEDGADLWHSLQSILMRPFAGAALRTMHAVGFLDLLIPEFHGIESLVVRDAYHRYTVDEHTFVVIDTLHALGEKKQPALEEWSSRFAQVLRELPHAELLYLAALMHDTGKGRSSDDHTAESARLTESLLARLDLDPYEARLVVDLVRNHLEMSAALRRDIFDSETIRSFAGKVQTQEALRMLLLLTYADLNAVNPDALTPWKAENLWRLYIATANYLDRSVDEDRVGRLATELVAHVAATLPDRAAAVAAYVEGFPERYVRTRSADQIRRHFEMSERFAADPVQIDFRYSPSVNELILLTLDRALLFANVAGALAAWGMNIVTADAFSNRQGIVVDSFRFTDSFHTLELNESERERFVATIHDVVSGRMSVDRLLSGRRRAHRRALKTPRESGFLFKDEASSHSTLLELITADTPGLLRALSLTLAAQGCNIEVALVDTEGETAIDVFYLTRQGRKLDASEKDDLVRALTRAIAENAL